MAIKTRWGNECEIIGILPDFQSYSSTEKKIISIPRVLISFEETGREVDINLEYLTEDQKGEIDGALKKAPEAG
ncbi:MAG: hypothetical protein JSW41_02595 [Candidatus Aenigmatarchaeota archaeon]|nr:MAG: hypothetical protein JSW41_02595 [Candidatus Aenigmarchaeota archaeon]